MLMILTTITVNAVLFLFWQDLLLKGSDAKNRKERVVVLGTGVCVCVKYIISATVTRGVEYRVGSGCMDLICMASNMLVTINSNTANYATSI
jgi:hypothetical protein